MKRTRGWIDVSVPIREGMPVWPGDPAVRVERLSDLAKGDHANVSVLSFGGHTGTHMDPPLHFLIGGRSLDTMPLEAAAGRARVVPIRDPESIKPEELARHRLRRGERILFKTRNSRRCWAAPAFVEDYVYITPAAADFLAERRVRTVGIDYLSVGGYKKDGAATHRALLGAGIWIIEGLDLSRVSAGVYELVCLPLRVLGSDGAPARAMLRRA